MKIRQIAKDYQTTNTVVLGIFEQYGLIDEDWQQPTPRGKRLCDSVSWQITGAPITELEWQNKVITLSLFTDLWAETALGGGQS